MNTPTTAPNTADAPVLYWQEGGIAHIRFNRPEALNAINEAVAFIERRIRKNKTRLARNLRPDALTSNIPAEFDVVEDNDFDIIRTKRFSVKPMTTDEAVLQMNLLGHSFYVFRNIETNAVCVVYHRNNGGYGLIETEE